MALRAARLAVFAIVLVAGCAPPLALRDQTIYVAPARVAGVPPAIHVFEVDSGSVVTELPDEAGAARAQVEPTINRSVSARGGRFFALETMKTLEGGEPFLRWCLRTLHEIEGEHYARSQGHGSPHQSVSDWGYPYDLEPLRVSLNADFVLISLFLEGRDTTGRNVVNFLARGFGGRTVNAKRLAEACVVDLRDGRVVWCAFKPLEGINLVEDRAAPRVVEQLLWELYAMSPELAARELLEHPPAWRAPPGRRPPAPPPAPPRTDEPRETSDD